MNFNVLILGTDINAYYMARCYHELYHKKVDMMGRYLFGATKYSKIINFIKVPGLEDPKIFAQALNDYSSQNNYEKIVLIATNDKLVRLIVENKEALNKTFVFNYPKLELINKLLLKDSFYQAFHQDLDLPKTLIYSCCDGQGLKDEFEYPLILKPANGVDYYKHPFPGISKVYKIQSFDELLKTIEMIKESGYQKNLIIQEFVPGDDTALYDAMFYCGVDGKVKLMTFAQIGLQERTATGVGNCTVLVNGFDERGYKEDIILAMKDFLEKIGYQGFAEFDLKYDGRDGKYKIFEINPRQARSSYYLSAGGHNLVKYLVDDLIYQREIPITLMKEKLAFSFVPKLVIKEYVTSQVLKREIWSLVKLGKFVRPLHYSADSGLKRKIYLFLRDINYIIKYWRLVW